MLHGVDEVAQGQTVYLDAHTKTAPPECYQRLQVKVTHPPKRFWPFLVVEWEERNTDNVKETRWLRVHKDDVKKRDPSARTASEKKDGDTTGGRVDGKWQRRLAIAQPVENVEGQETLF